MTWRLAFQRGTSRSRLLKEFTSSHELTEALVYMALEPWHADPLSYWLARIYTLLRNRWRGPDDEEVTIEDVLPQLAEDIEVGEADGLARRLGGLKIALDEMQKAPQRPRRPARQQKQG